MTNITWTLYGNEINQPVTNSQRFYRGYICWIVNLTNLRDFLRIATPSFSKVTWKIALCSSSTYTTSLETQRAAGLGKSGSIWTRSRWIILQTEVRSAKTDFRLKDLPINVFLWYIKTFIQKQQNLTPLKTIVWFVIKDIWDIRRAYLTVDGKNIALLAVGG